jgi:hypothetical protein
MSARHRDDESREMTGTSPHPAGMTAHVAERTTLLAAPDRTDGMQRMSRPWVAGWNRSTAGRSPKSPPVDSVRTSALVMDASRTRTRVPGRAGWRPRSNEVISGLPVHLSPVSSSVAKRLSAAPITEAASQPTAGRPYRLPEELPDAPSSARGRLRRLLTRRSAMIVVKHSTAEPVGERSVHAARTAGASRCAPAEGGGADRVERRGPGRRPVSPSARLIRVRDALGSRSRETRQLVFTRRRIPRAADLPTPSTV